MPKLPLHTLIWSGERTQYELFTHEHLDQCFRPEDEQPWFIWLKTATSFAFQGTASRLNVYKESRPRGGEYWYAYHTISHHTHKRYLGQTARVTFTRLEEAAKALGNESTPPSLAQALPQNEREAIFHQALPVTPHEVLPGIVLLSNRLSYPLLPSSLVVRERLLARLDAVLSQRLTLLSASAGWGKTTLLSAWAARSAFPIAWLSLDELDNDPVRFWVSVLAALRTCSPGIGEVALAMLQSPQPPPLTTILTTLLNELSRQDAPGVLVLDDYHLINEQDIHDSMLFLLDHLPATLHLVVSSRFDPPLMLSRLRVRGQLLELRDADLRFEEKEVARFLQHAMDLALSEEEAVQLGRRTEGWIAGLQLAALSMRQREDLSAFVQGFTGGHRHVLDYIQEEILARQPQRLQNLLLQTAILTRISASLCQAVTYEAESAEVLSQAEHANLFLVPLDEERRWYRRHDLFREALLARLHATQPELMPLLHQRAARWYEAQGELREAISHALAASDFLDAARLMEQAAEEVWLHGEGQTLYHWVMALPEVVVRGHARFVLTAALYLLNSSASTIAAQRARARTQVAHMAERVEVMLRQQDEGSLPATEVALLHQRLHLLRLWSELFEVITIGGSERHRFIDQQIQQLDLEDEIIWQMIPLSSIFVLRWNFLGEGASLASLFQSAKQRAIQAGDRFATIKVMQWLAGIYLRAGQLRLAYQECSVALDLITQINGNTLLAGYFYCWQAEILYHWNWLEEARSILRKLIHDAQVWQQIDLQICGYFLLMDVERAAGDLSTISQVSQQTQDLVQRQGFALHQIQVTAFQVRSWLVTGDLVQADGWAKHVFFSQEHWEPNRKWEVLALVSVFLAHQQSRSALATLERFNAQLDHPEDIATTISFLALSVVALYQVGEEEQAHTILARLLALTEPEGYVRVYLDAGEPMRQMLQSLLNEPKNTANSAFAIFRSAISTLLAAFKQEEQKRSSRANEQIASLYQQEVPTHLPASASSAPVLPEPLTSQERRVLRLLVAGRSNQEIARMLVISLNTAKTHVQNLYRKLNKRGSIVSSFSSTLFL